MIRAGPCRKEVNNMAKAVTNIILHDEEEANMADTAWSPGMIVEVLKEIDPDDLDDVQQGLYNYLWEPGGPLEAGRVKGGE
jgi:hypothetical protein